MDKQVKFSSCRETGFGPRRANAFAIAMTVSVISAACSSETVARLPPAPVDWQSLEPRPAQPDAGTISARNKRRAVASTYTSALSSHGGAQGGPASSKEGDFAALGRLLDENAHFTFAGFKDVHGSGSVVRAHEALLGAFDDRAFVTSRVLIAEGSQIVEWTMTGVHRAEHKPVTIKGLTMLWTKDNGSLLDVHLYLDEARANAQIGIGPKALLRLPAPSVPSGERQEVVQARTPEESANVRIVHAALDALESSDEPQYLASMSDDVELITLESEEPVCGKAGARAYFKAMHKAIAELDVQIDNAWGIGPFVVVEYHIVGEQRGPLGWVPAQKDSLLKMFIVDVIELRGEKIARVWRYDNPSQILSSPERDLK